MPHPRTWNIGTQKAGTLGPTAKIDLFIVEKESWFEQANLPEHFGADEHGTTNHPLGFGQHIVLPTVNLTGAIFIETQRPAIPISTGIPQPAAVGMMVNLCPENSGLRHLLRSPDKFRNNARINDSIVIEQNKE